MSSEDNWANRPFKIIEWVKDNASSLDIDGSNFSLGLILDHIIGDDLNSFTGLNSKNENLVNKALEEIKARVVGEIDTPETPEEIRGTLVDFYQKISEGYDTTKLYAYWTENVKETAEELLGDYAMYNQAREYYRDNSKLVEKEFVKAEGFVEMGNIS